MSQDKTPSHTPASQSPASAPSRPRESGSERNRSDQPPTPAEVRRQLGLDLIDAERKSLRR